MATDRHPYFRMAAALLALLGLFDAAYLALEHIVGDAGGYCPSGGGCAAVQSSVYSALFGVPVSYIGVAGYAALLSVALLSLSVDTIGGLPTPALLLVLASCGALFSFYLSYLQVGVIGAVCFWCVASAAIELGIWLAALLDWRMAGKPAGVPE